MSCLAGPSGARLDGRGARHHTKTDLVHRWTLDVDRLTLKLIAFFFVARWSKYVPGLEILGELFRWFSRNNR
jgi:hypothetical protein